MFRKFPPPPDPLQNANFINIVVSVSLRMGQDYYQTYARTRVEPRFFLAIFGAKDRKISRKWPEMAPFFLRESLVAQDSGDIAVWQKNTSNVVEQQVTFASP